MMYIFVLNFFIAYLVQCLYSRQINHECLTCAGIPDTGCTFMCLTCSMVLDTTYLIVFNVFSGSQPKTDGKHKNEISNIVEVKKNLLSNSQTLQQCYFHLFTGVKLMFVTGVTYIPTWRTRKMVN